MCISISYPGTVEEPADDHRGPCPTLDCHSALTENPQKSLFGRQAILDDLTFPRNAEEQRWTFSNAT